MPRDALAFQIPLNAEPIVETVSDPDAFDRDDCSIYAVDPDEPDIVDDRNMRLMRQCSHLCSINPEVSARMIYTRDVGHHSGGWWKNPDYERCLHLSISFSVNPTDVPLPKPPLPKLKCLEDDDEAFTQDQHPHD